MRNIDRFLTTHSGSLPRPERLVQMMFAQQAGEEIESGALDAAIDDAVAEMVARQATAGIAIVNEGEMSKPSYATYIKDRLHGFGGSSGSYSFQDLDDFPGTRAKVFADTGRAKRRAPACPGLIEPQSTYIEHPELSRALRLPAKAVAQDKLHAFGMKSRDVPPPRSVSSRSTSLDTNGLVSTPLRASAPPREPHIFNRSRTPGMANGMAGVPVSFDGEHALKATAPPIPGQDGAAIPGRTDG